jgi:hypothetical protein
MQRRRLYPMPVEGLIDHPHAMALPAAAFGMLCRLSLHFWRTECRALPRSQDELRSIARAHLPTWRRWKADILKVFEDIRPELERYYEGRESRGGTIRMVALRGSAAAAANRRRERIEKNQPAFTGSIDAVPKRRAESKHESVARRFSTPAMDASKEDSNLFSDI